MDLLIIAVFGQLFKLSAKWNTR